MKKQTTKLFASVLAGCAMSFACIGGGTASAETAPEVPAIHSIAPSMKRLAPAEAQPGYESPINWDELADLNEDIYAWIYIPGMSIDYPLLQHPTEDNFYLDYTVYKVAEYPGSLYTQTRTAKDFTDHNTVIYGHNMKNGDMFGNLKNFRDIDFLNKHREIKIYTPTGEMTYKIFAAVVYNDRLLTDSYDFKTTEGRQAFLDSLNMLNHPDNHILDDVEVTADDYFLTLSTCVGGESDHRYLVVGVLK